MIVNKELLAMLLTHKPKPEKVCGIPIVQNDGLPSSVAVFVQDGQPVACLQFSHDPTPARPRGDGDQNGK